MRPMIFLLTLLLSVAVQGQVCTGAAFFNGQRCAPCSTNCQCSQENTCSSCLPGYTYDALFQHCLQCPTPLDSVNVGCKECCYQVQGPAFVCSQCPTGNYIFQQGGQCLKVEGCLSISSQGLCLSCTAGYFLSQGICSPCHSSCASCHDATLCLSCAPGFTNATDVHFSLCQACPAGCSSCPGGTCTSCLTGYYLTSPTCTACGSHCDVCTAGGCSTCGSGAVLISGSCYLCTDVGQQGSIGCLTCYSSGTRVQCSSCAGGYFLNPTTKQCETCTSRFSNSVLCTQSQPLQCNADSDSVLSNRFYLVGSVCVSNVKLCKSMADSSGTCSSCYFDSTFGYYSLSGGSCTLCNVAGCNSYSSTCQCLGCSDGYQFINNQCIACQTLHCSKCQALVTACQTCNHAYGRLSSACQLCQPSHCSNCDGDYSICATCDDGYFLSNGACFKCQDNCQRCQSGTVCSACAVGYYLQANGRCKILPSNCVSIDSSSLDSNVGACKRCSYGFILLDGNCYPCGLSVFNLQLCNDKHCPDYYAQLTFEPSLMMGRWGLLLLLWLSLWAMW